MSDAIIVLNAREIKECISSIAELPATKIWVTGYSEGEIARAFLPVLAEHVFDRYFVVSDDVIVRPYAFEAVRAILDQGRPVATGYSQRSHTEWIVNLTDEPLAATFPKLEAYSFRHFKDVVSWPTPALPTWFAGMSLTGMSRELWQRFPFDCFKDSDGRSFASDFHLSHRLQEAEVPILAAREGFAYHWRHEWKHTNDPRDAKPSTDEKSITVT